jgi:hypothetical protein
MSILLRLIFLHGTLLGFIATIDSGWAFLALCSLMVGVIGGLAASRYFVTVPRLFAGTLDDMTQDNRTHAIELTTKISGFQGVSSDSSPLRPIAILKPR